MNRNFIYPGTKMVNFPTFYKDPFICHLWETAPMYTSQHIIVWNLKALWTVFDMCGHLLFCELKYFVRCSGVYISPLRQLERCSNLYFVNEIQKPTTKNSTRQYIDKKYWQNTTYILLDLGADYQIIFRTKSYLYIYIYVVYIGSSIERGSAPLKFRCHICMCQRAYATENKRKWQQQQQRWWHHFSFMFYACKWFSHWRQKKKQSQRTTWSRVSLLPC